MVRFRCAVAQRCRPEAGGPNRCTMRRGSATRFAGLWPACRLKPAFQAVRVVRVDGGYDVRGAERRACRSETRRSKPVRHTAQQRNALCGPAARVPV